MKLLVIGGNRFVGLRFCLAMDNQKDVDLHILNRTGQVAHVKNATIYKGDRTNLNSTHIDQEFDAIVDFANFKEQDSLSAINYFKKVGRYISISTVSVYGNGANMAEDKFNPQTWDLSQPELSSTHAGLLYQDGKRRSEAVLAQKASFPVSMIRLPFILGPDDYTQRLNFHIHRIEHNQPIFMPNPEARISLIHAQDAAQFLEWSLQQTFTGPLNVASPQPLRLQDMIKEIEKRTSKRALFVAQPTPQNTSPYGVNEDYFVDVSKCQALGFSVRPIAEWLPDLIEEGRENPVSHQVH